MIPMDQYKALPDDTRAALLKLKTFSRGDKPVQAQADSSQKAATSKKSEKQKKAQGQTVLVASSVDSDSQSVGQFSQFGPVPGQFLVTDPRQSFVPLYDQRQHHVLAAQYVQGQVHPSAQPMFQYGMQSLPAPSAPSGWPDSYGRAPVYAAPPSHFFNSGGGGGGGGGHSQSGGVGGVYNVPGGGGGYQGAPSFFPAYAQHPPSGLQPPRSLKMLGSIGATDSRAGDPGDYR